MTMLNPCDLEIVTGGVLDNDYIDYLINTRMNTKLKKGDEITPIYETTQMNSEEAGSGKESEEKGKVIKIKKNSKIKVEKLRDGLYLNPAVIGDTRGDVYYSKVVGSKVSGGKVKKKEVEADFFGRDY